MCELIILQEKTMGGGATIPIETQIMLNDFSSFKKFYYLVDRTLSHEKNS